MNITVDSVEFDTIISALEEYSYSLQEAAKAREVTKLQIKLLSLTEQEQRNEHKP